MKDDIRIFAVTVAVVLVSYCCYPSSSRACTTFTIKDKTGSIFLGRNFDYLVGDGQLVVNKRGLRKTAFIRPPEKQMSWVSKYGAVTFNLIGKEFPCGGMNEAGLVVEMMRLAETTYPAMDDRFGLTVFQWIQYQLDTSKTVEDVIASDSLVRISRQSTTVNHFMVTDRTGRTAIIEYLDGTMKAYTGNDLKLRVLTNSPYQQSLGHITRYSGLGGNAPLPHQDESSHGRFATAAAMVATYDGSGNAVDYSDKILDAVWQLKNKEWNTQWSIVYDVSNGNIHYRTAKNRETRSVAFKEINFGCRTGSRIIDVDKSIRGASDMTAYSTEAHRALIDKVFNAVPAFKTISPERRNALVQYAEGTTCMENR